MMKLSMKINIKLSVTILILFLASTFVLAKKNDFTPPSWSVNASSFSFNTNMAIQLQVNDLPENSSGNMIGAFVDGEVRGVANGMNFGGVTYYFLTVYSNSPSTDVFDFKVYLSSEDDVFDIEETHAYNAVQAGSVYTLNAYLASDQPISLTAIPNQTQVQGLSFDTLTLSDFLVQTDNDPILWTTSNSPNITMNIIDDQLIFNPNPNWVGTETITITATEQTANSYQASQTVEVEVLPDYGAPKWNSVPAQNIGKNQSFVPIELPDYVQPYGGNTLEYNYILPQKTGSASASVWSVNPGAFQYSMTVTAHLRYGTTDFANTNDRLLAYDGTTLAGVASPTLVNGEVFYFLTVYANNRSPQITFKAFNADYQQIYNLSNEIAFQNGAEYGTPANPYLLNAAPVSARTEPSGEMAIDRIQPDWNGTQSIGFIVFDSLQPLVNADTIYADFIVLNENSPEIIGIPDQYIELGSSFSVFDLDLFVNEYDGDDIIWSAPGNADLNVIIDGDNKVYVTPQNLSWTGESSIVFTATDETVHGLKDEQEVYFTVGLPNQPPELSVIPVQSITQGEEFDELDVENYLTEPNNDPVTWSYFFKSQSLGTANPNWSISPGRFQYSMTMTTQVEVRSTFSAATNHKLAAFHNGELRGVATAQEVAGQWLFFLNIYANQSQDSIYFKYYDPNQEAIYEVSDTVKFVSQKQVGTIADPHPMYAGYINPNIENTLLKPKAINGAWTGSDTLYIVVTEQGTYENYKDTTMVVLKVQPSGPPLPVDLLSFTGRSYQGQSILNWLIANPDNIEKYEIQRSTHPSSYEWQTIGERLHSDEQDHYNWVDKMPFYGFNYYRLRMVDFDGRFEYSKIVSTGFENPEGRQINIYPNPSFIKTINVDVELNEVSEFSIQIVNAAGHILQDLNVVAPGGRSFVPIDISGYPAGNYFARIKIKNRVTSKSFVILRD